MYRKSIENCLCGIRRSGAAVLCGLLMLLLAGCGWFGNSELTFTPAVFPECKGPNIVVNVSWDVRSKTKGPIKIIVYKPAQNGILWYQGSPKGHAATGKWMADGSTMRILGPHGKVLSERTLETVPCTAGKR